MRSGVLAVTLWISLAPLVSSGAEAFPLWAQGAPGALGKEEKDIPTLTPFVAPADKASGAAVVICPGGGYGGLAAHEGNDYALWLNEQGIAGFVLRYRLGSAGYRHPAMLQDAARAVRTVRARAAEWKLDSKKIGIMGSSAGGHLASTLLTHFDEGKADAADLVDRQSSRPDFGILCYPVITMGAHTHTGSRANLLGKEPTPEQIADLSNELRVTAQTPPCFVWHTWEDPVVGVENSLQYAAALRQAGVPFDLHIYERGQHGIGLGRPDRHPWVADCAFWLRTRGLAQ